MHLDLRRRVSARVGHQSVIREKGVRERVSVEEARVGRGGAAGSGEAVTHERGHHLATDDIASESGEATAARASCGKLGIMLPSRVGNLNLESSSLKIEIRNCFFKI